MIRHSNIRYFSNGFFLALILSIISCQKTIYDPPKAPEETIASFQLDSLFTIEVFAAEPIIADPVEIIFDQRGRIFVVEMPDYPFKPDPGQGQGKIKQLFDDDQDGKIDRSVVFADHISEATSLQPWKDGLLIAAAPNISWMRDNDMDGKADTSEILFTGFFENNSEAQITNLKFMPDNWIYASNNGQAGEVKYLRGNTGITISMSGGDFRFRLDRDRYELVSGPAQFGHAFNDKIHRFVTQNTLHLRQPVIPWKYLHRNPLLASKTATHNISDHDLEMFQKTPPPYWRAERTRRRQAAYDAQGQGRIEYAEDHFTGASGTTFYGGHTFPEGYYGSIFIGDVAGNLIHRDLIKSQEESPAYIASRADREMDKEFLASTDSWFRPANFTVGPDGFLYVVDMYRQHIETPLSIPEDLKENMDFLAGSDMGRIYRIRPKNQPATTTFENLGEKNIDVLVDLLSHPNRWHRLQAQRLILERNDKSISPRLLEVFENSTQDLARLHAFYCLEALDALNLDITKKALQDRYPVIREQAILLAEELPGGKELIAPLINDLDPHVSLQACLSLGSYTGEEIDDYLFNVLTKHKGDEWFRLAILTSASGSSFSFFKKLVDSAGILETSDPQAIDFGESIAMIIGKRQDQSEMANMQSLLLSDHIRSVRNYDPVLKAFLSGYDSSDHKVELNPQFQTYLKKIDVTTK